MGALALVALLGFGLFAVALDDSGDTTDNSEPDTPETPTDPETPPVDGATLALDGDETVTGTEGDDTLVALAETREEQALIDETQQIDLLGGDDSVTIRNDMHLVINAGDGDDVIDSQGLGIRINGDAGSDTIYAGSADAALGGAGDDQMVYRGDTDFIDQTAVLDGGAGNDHMLAYVEAGAAPEVGDSDRGGYRMLGGAGADVFELQLDIVDYGAPDAPDVVRELTSAFSDFVPGEDSLIIDLSEEDRTLATQAFEYGDFPVGSGENEYSRLVLTFAATDTQPQVELSVRFGSRDVTMDDITILTAPAPEVALAS